MRASEHERSAGGELPQGPTWGDTRLVQRDITSDSKGLILPPGDIWQCLETFLWTQVWEGATGSQRAGPEMALNVLLGTVSGPKCHGC